MQVKYIVGYNIPHADRMQDIVYNLIARWKQFRWLEAAMGLSFIALLVAIKNAPRFHKCAPHPTQISRYCCWCDTVWLTVIVGMVSMQCGSSKAGIAL